MRLSRSLLVCTLSFLLVSVFASDTFAQRFGRCGGFGFRAQRCCRPVYCPPVRCRPVCCPPTCCQPQCDPCVISSEKAKTGTQETCEGKRDTCRNNCMNCAVGSARNECFAFCECLWKHCEDLPHGACNKPGCYTGEKKSMPAHPFPIHGQGEN